MDAKALNQSAQADEEKLKRPSVLNALGVGGSFGGRCRKPREEEYGLRNILAAIPPQNCQAGSRKSLDEVIHNRTTASTRSHTLPYPILEGTGHTTRIHPTRQHLVESRPMGG